MRIKEAVDVLSLYASHRAKSARPQAVHISPADLAPGFQKTNTDDEN